MSKPKSEAARPKWEPENQAVYWFIRDQCRWPAGARAVYEALYKHWGKKGSGIFPSDDRIAQATGFSQATIKRWRNWLRDHGLIQWTTSYRPEKGKGNSYVLLPPWTYLGTEANLAHGELGKLGQTELGNLAHHGENLAQFERDLAHGELGKLGHGELLRLQSYDSNKDSNEAAKSRQGCGGSFSASPRLGTDPWDGIDGYLDALFRMIEGVGTLELVRAHREKRKANDGPCQRLLDAVRMREQPNPYADVARAVIAGAPATGKPALWLWSQVLISTAQQLGEADVTPESLVLTARRCLAAGRLDTGYPEWLLVRDWVNWLHAKGFSAYCLQQLSLGARTPDEVNNEQEYSQDLRWTRIWAAVQQSDPLCHLLCEAQDAGAQVVDCPDVESFGLVNVPPDLLTRMSKHRADLCVILACGYRLDDSTAAAFTAEYSRQARLFREDLHAAMAAGNQEAVIALARDEQHDALEVARGRGWLHAYPEMARVIEVTYDVMAAS